MYLYQLSQGNPEGTDYTLSLSHEQLFTDDQFQEICEAAIVETLERQCDKDTFVALSCIDCDMLFSIFTTKGFQRTEISSSYYLEPYWGKDSIKNKELLEWTDKQYDKDESVEPPK